MASTGAGYINGLVCNLVGTLYPLYRSFKAIESPEKDDDTLWLTFWVLYALVALFESATDVLLMSIPFYFELKLVFLLLLQLAGAAFARTLYTAYVRPYFLARQERFDQFLVSMLRAVFHGIISTIKNIVSALVSRPPSPPQQQPAELQPVTAAATEDNKKKDD